MSRLSLALVLVLLTSTVALAHPPPEFAAEPPVEVTLVEWSTWLRGGGVIARSATPAPTAARATSPTPERDRSVEGALGAGFTLPLGRRIRIGPWVELRDWGLPIAGGEVTVLASKLDMFWYEGKAAITARAGGNPDVRTAQLGAFYRAPWDLFGRQPRGSRYIIGAGVIATITQNRHDPHDWSATVGVELEPVGALRYLLGIRSWY